jgi:predicted RNA methylase
MTTKINKYLRNIFNNNVPLEEKDIHYKIENFSVLLPNNHKLPEYQLTYKNYDKKLRLITENTNNDQEKNVIIDIGANVGDSAAYIRSFTNSHIYCIEGDLYYLNYLRKNITSIPNATIIY